MEAAAPAGRSWTWLGLLIALLGIPVVVTLYRLAVPDPGTGASVAVREIAILGLVAVLIWIVRSRERLPLSSIGLRFDRPWRSLGWTLLLMLAIAAGLVACLALFQLIGARYGEGGRLSVSIWATLLTVLRAGIAEEIFFRGYAIERLETLTGSKWIAAAISLVAFAGFHFRQGLAGIFIAFVLGVIITGFYLWRRDLLAAILAHFLIDFIPNVLLPVLGGD